MGDHARVAAEWLRAARIVREQRDRPRIAAEWLRAARSVREQRDRPRIAAEWLRAARIVREQRDRPRIVVIELYGGSRPMLSELQRRHGIDLTLVAAYTCDMCHPNPCVDLPGVAYEHTEADMASESTLEGITRFILQHISRADVLLVVGGPPCTAYSDANPRISPRSLATKMASLEVCDELVRSFLEVANFARRTCAERRLQFVGVMENVHSHVTPLRRRPFMRAYMAEYTDVARHMVNWCAYNYGMPKKPTDIWMFRLPGWMPLVCKGGGRCPNTKFRRATQRWVHRVTVKGLKTAKDRAPWASGFVRSIVDAILASRR